MPQDLELKRDLKRVTQWLLCASEQVGSEYMQLPVADKEEPAYRERVYCYELYHRWRSIGFTICRSFNLGAEYF